MAESDLRSPEVTVFPFQAVPGLEFPEYAKLREREPVALVRLASGGQAYLVSRYEDVRRVMADPVFGRAALTRPGAAVLIQGSRVPYMLTNMDPPDHTRIRTLVAKAFTVRGVEPLRPKARETADALINDMVATGPPVDFVAAFASPYHALIVSELLGVPDKDRGKLQEWTAATTAVTSHSPEQIAEAYEQLMAYMQQLTTEKRAAPADDLISALVAAHDQGDRLSEQELLYAEFLLIGAGFETMVRMLTNAVLTFHTYPDQLARLRAEPELVPAAVEELLRYVPIVVSTLERVPREDVELSGVTIPAGSTVIPLHYSANRDSAFIADPDRFDVTRAPMRHLSFGHGIHHCLGAPQARLELETALTALLHRLPNLRPAVPPEALDWRAGGNSIGPSALPVTW